MSMSRTFGKGFSDTGSRRSKASRASKGSRVRSIGSSKTGKSSKKQVDEEKHQYKFYNFVNTTNQDAGGLYPQFMYEAIIRKATRNKNFKYKVRSTPFPAI